MSLPGCPLCGAEARRSVFAIDRFPTFHVLPAERPESEITFAPVDVSLCGGCGHLYNAAFDPALGDRIYASAPPTNVAVHPTMSKAVTDLAAQIHALSGKQRPTVLEVGGGYADLSRAMCAWADSVTLVEPNAALAAADFPESNLQVVNSSFPVEGIDGPFDLVVCKQVLEHVSDPVGFLAMIRPYIAEDGVFYLEVPALDYVVDHGSLVDFHYPHVQYFSDQAIANAAALAGFRVRESAKIKLDHDAYFVLEPSTIADPADLPRAGDRDPATLKQFLDGRLAAARRSLAHLPPNRALYGACAYSQSLMGLFPEFTGIKAIYDDTPGLDGLSAYSENEEMWVGYAKPETLEGVDAVVITAYMHDKVIGERLRAMGYHGAIMSVRADRLAGADGRPGTVFSEGR